MQSRTETTSVPPTANGNAFNRARIIIEACGLYCAAGSTVAELLECWHAGGTPPQKLPFPSDWLPHSAAFQIDEPDLRSQIYDRKAVRTMDKQALSAMAAAFACVKSLNGFADPNKVGLYMGIPMVDEPLPGWETLNELGGKAADLSDILHSIMNNTPPMTGLMLINSTACSHIASQFCITGTTGVFSPWADAGLAAVIEAAWSIAEGDNDSALVGASAPTVNPFLYLNYETQGLLQPEFDLPVPGEGAAFVALRAADSDSPVGACLSGYARSFEPNPAAAQVARQRCMEEALACAGVPAEEIGWILFDPYCGRAGVSAERAAIAGLFGESAPLYAWHDVCGYLGAAQPVLDIAIAAAALSEGWRVVADPLEQCFDLQKLPLRHVLINASGCRGQFVSLVMSRYE